MTSSRSLRRNAAWSALSLGLVAATSILGQIATLPNLAPWYAGLVKPSFNPPNWAFAPVWTTLYLLMAVAFWLVLRNSNAPRDRRRRAIVSFLLLIFLNASWPWMFFWARSPLLGMLNIVPQFVVTVATAASFAKVDPRAAVCMLPLIAWVAFAGVLNAAIWVLNG